jgi:hypothetical protein
MGQATSVSANVAANQFIDGIDVVDGFVPRQDVWVQLRNAPSDYAYDQALLICELDGDQWMAWVPDHGELCLNRSQFHRIGDMV